MKRRNVLLALCTVMAGCGGGGDSPESAPQAESVQPPVAPVQHPAEEPQAPAPEPAASNPAPVPAIADWGDSLTLGLAQQSRLLEPTRTIYMKGVGGETSTQIRARFLATPDLFRATTVIWAGRNNYGDTATVPADIAAMVAALPHRRFLVLGILNANTPSEWIGGTGFQKIESLNAALLTAYGDQFIDPRPALLAAADQASAQDAIDVQHGVTPTSLRTDSLHLSAAGSLIVATLVDQKIRASGW